MRRKQMAINQFKKTVCPLPPLRSLSHRIQWSSYDQHISIKFYLLNFSVEQITPCSVSLFFLSIIRNFMATTIMARPKTTTTTTEWTRFFFYAYVSKFFVGPFPLFCCLLKEILINNKQKNRFSFCSCYFHNNNKRIEWRKKCRLMRMVIRI